MKSLKLRIAIGLVILALFFVGAWIINGYSRHASSTGPDGAYESIASEPISTIARPNEIIAASNTERGRAVGKSMPKLGTAEWTKWYQALSPVDRHSWAMAQDEQEKQPEMAKIEKGKIQQLNYLLHKIKPSVELVSSKKFIRKFTYVQVNCKCYIDKGGLKSIVLDLVKDLNKLVMQLHDSQDFYVEAKYIKKLPIF